MDRRRAIIETLGRLLACMAPLTLSGCAALSVKKSSSLKTTNKKKSLSKSFKSEEGAAIVSSKLEVIHDSEKQLSDSKQIGIEERRHKSKLFDQRYAEDIWTTSEEWRLVVSIFGKLKAIQSFVGHGRFNILSFDEALAVGRRSSRLRQFTRDELVYVDGLFARDAQDYGFYGLKVCQDLTKRVEPNMIKKIAYTGHYLFKDQYHDIYKRMVSDVGRSLILTSGVRGIVKQIYLFMAKTITVNGNLSQASRSLAPPGYSYHAVGDFDVGKRGLGGENFTNAFSQTNEFKRLMDLGYIDFRYPADNLLGVRFEPWHIEGYKRQGQHCPSCG